MGECRAGGGCKDAPDTNKIKVQPIKKIIAHPSRRRSGPALGGEVGVAAAVAMVTPLLLGVVTARAATVGEVPRGSLVLVPPRATAPAAPAPAPAAAATAVVLVRAAERTPPLPAAPPRRSGVRHLEGTHGGTSHHGPHRRRRSLYITLG